jgi:hypothetical protein
VKRTVTLATVETRRLDGRNLIATLTDAGWSIPDAEELERAFNMRLAPEHYKPADGDPVTSAATQAADILGGFVTFIRSATPVAAGSVSRRPLSRGRRAGHGCDNAPTSNPYSSSPSAAAK